MEPEVVRPVESPCLVDILNFLTHLFPNIPKILIKQYLKHSAVYCVIQRQNDRNSVPLEDPPPRAESMDQLLASQAFLPTSDQMNPFVHHFVGDGDTPLTQGGEDSDVEEEDDEGRPRNNDLIWVLAFQPHSASACQIDLIGVLPECQGQGLATKGLKLLETKYTNLTVFSDVYTSGFFLKLGYRHDPLLVSPYSMSVFQGMQPLTKILASASSASSWIEEYQDKARRFHLDTTAVILSMSKQVRKLETRLERIQALCTDNSIQSQVFKQEPPEAIEYIQIASIEELGSITRLDESLPMFFAHPQFDETVDLKTGKFELSPPIIVSQNVYDVLPFGDGYRFGLVNVHLGRSARLSTANVPNEQEMVGYDTCSFRGRAKLFQRSSQIEYAIWNRECIRMHAVVTYIKVPYD